MLRALDPDDSPERAYPVPWRVDRIYESHSLVTNVSGSALDFVRVFVESAPERTGTESWGQMLPEETAELCLCSVETAHTIVTIAWFRPETGIEYVWRFTP